MPSRLSATQHRQAPRRSRPSIQRVHRLRKRDRDSVGSVSEDRKSSRIEARVAASADEASRIRTRSLAVAKVASALVKPYEPASAPTLKVSAMRSHQRETREKTSSRASKARL